MSFEKAAQIMREGMGTQFDPGMLVVFLSCRSKLERYYSFIRDAPGTGRAATETARRAGRGTTGYFISKE